MSCLVLAQIFFHFRAQLAESDIGPILNFVHRHDVKTVLGAHRLGNLSCRHGEHDFFNLRFQRAPGQKAELAELHAGVRQVRNHDFLEGLTRLDPLEQRLGLGLPKAKGLLRGVFRSLDDDLPDLARFLHLVIALVVVEPVLRLALFQIDLLGDLGEGQDHIGYPDLFRFHVAVICFLVARFDLLLRRLMALFQFIGRQNGVGKIPLLVLQAGKRGHLSLRHKIGAKQGFLQLLRRQVLPQLLLKAFRRQSHLTGG